jgi:hypothetical protein
MELKLIVLVGACVTFCSSAIGRDADIKLPDLVAQSEAILYGHVVKGNRDVGNQVSFLAQTVLKGQGFLPNAAVPLCNPVGSSDSYDLRSASKPLIVFVTSSADCLMPVHGLASTIVVSGGYAQTAAIFDQPSREPVAGFLGKIRRLVGQAR